MWALWTRSRILLRREDRGVRGKARKTEVVHYVIRKNSRLARHPLCNRCIGQRSTLQSRVVAARLFDRKNIKKEGMILQVLADLRAVDEGIDAESLERGAARDTGQRKDLDSAYGAG